MNQKQNNPWLLPEGVEEILPPYAGQIETICRSLIDNFQSWGYQLVIPPMIEFLDSLLTGTGEDLELQTFKLTDLLSGRLMGIRADTTPQVARIDAHNMQQDAPNRLCYMGTVLHTRPESHGASRSPLQLGAELYGHAGIESDVEIMCLMLSSLELLGLRDLHIDIGHVGIYQALMQQADLDEQLEERIFDILQRKARPELESLLTNEKVATDTAEAILNLIEFYGDASVLEQAQEKFAACGEPVQKCLKELSELNRLVKTRLPDAPLYFDLSELRGYHYHTGIMFTAYVAGTGSGIAFGGRYNGMGESFGRARPATGFSTDVKKLMRLINTEQSVQKKIYAPWQEDDKLNNHINKLRANGEIVIQAMPGQSGGATEMGCQQELVLENGNWVAKPIK